MKKIICMFFYLLVSKSIVYAATSMEFFQVMAKDENGSFLKMDQYHGIKYCEELGLRLPTARDFADFATRYGAQILPTSYPDLKVDTLELKEEMKLMASMNFYPIKSYSEEQGLKVSFYYNSKGFDRPEFMPKLDGFLSSTKNAYWESTGDPLLSTDPVPETFNTNGHIGPRIYRKRYVTCIK